MVDPKQRLFRQAALDRLSSPERIDELMEVTSRQGWLALLGLCVVLAVTVVWGLLGAIPTVVKGQGILLREGSLRTVDAPASGRLTQLVVGPGEDVARDQLVAWIQPADNQTVAVTSPYAGRIVDVRVSEGSIIQATMPLFSLEQPGRTLEAVVYLAPTDGKQVQPGMEVQLSPSSVKQEEYGRLLGRVSEVGAFPVTTTSLQRTLGNEDLAKTLTKSGPPIEVHVELLRSGSTRSSYQWTSTLDSLSSVLAAVAGPLFPSSAAPGPPVALESGTMATADVVTDQQAPVYLILARFNR
ncbi:MAG TPA: HlyD family efflux transporter periplasmic adaptor subunit [Chloroflexota bacterium]|jgi:multidrug efflux pump subunit AcrA (membrane-fusion protein)